MAKVLEFDRKHFGRDGVVDLTRGDDWKLEATVVNEMGNYREAMDLSQYSVSGYFKADCTEELSASGITRIQAVIEADDCSGEFLMKVPASGSELVAKAENGVDIYVEIEDSEGCIETVYTHGQPIAVRDQNFQTF